MFHKTTFIVVFTYSKLPSYKLKVNSKQLHLASLFTQNTLNSFEYGPENPEEHNSLNSNCQ